MSSAKVRFEVAATRLGILVQPHLGDRAPLPQSEDALPLVQLLRRTAASFCDGGGETAALLVTSAALSALLHLAERHSDRELRTESVFAVSDVLRALASGGENGAKTLAAVLPGVSTALLSVALGDFKQGRALTSAAIDSWALAVSSALDDALPVAAEKKKQEEEEESQQTSGPRKMPPAVVRDAEWLQMTGERVALMADRLFSVHHGPQLAEDAWQVRFSLVSAAKTLLERCGSRSLRNCVPLLVDCCVLHLDDEFEQVSALASLAVKGYLARLEEKTSSCSVEEAAEFLAQLSGGSRNQPQQQSPLTLFEDRLIELLSSLLRLDRMASFSDEKRLRAIRMANGYIRLLGSHIPGILLVVLNKFTSALVLLLEFDAVATDSDRQLSQQTSKLGVHQIEQGLFSTALQTAILRRGYPRFTFRRFSDDRVAAALREMCKLLSAHGGFALLYSHFRDLLVDSSSSKVRPQLLFALSGVLSGASTLSADAASSIADMLLEVNFELRSEPKHRRDIAGALIAECIGVVCQKPASIASLLPKVLYPCLELLGEGMDCSGGKLAQAAWETLSVLSRLSLFEGDVKMLVSANTDYLIDSLAKRMAQTYLYPTAPHIFRALLRLTGEAFLPLLEDTLGKVLESLQSRRANREPLLHVLHDVVDAVFVPEERDKPRPTTGEGEEDQIPSERPETQGAREDDLAGLSPEERAEKIRTFFQEHRRSMEEEEAAAVAGEEPSIQRDGAKEKSPKAAHVHKILETCVHHLGDSDPEMRLLVLDTVLKGVVVLDFEGENERDADGQVPLWPLLHALWDPLMHRLQDHEKAVALKALEVVRVMAIHSGGFLSGRLASAVLPSLAGRAAALSKTGESARFSWDWREKRGLLRCLEAIYSVANPGPGHAADMLRACMGFFAAGVPRELQALSFNVLQTLARRDVSDAMWLALLPFVDCELPQPPSPEFAPIPASVRTLPRGSQTPDASTRSWANKLLAFLDSI